MKKILISLLSLMLILTGCTGETGENQVINNDENSTLSIVTSFYPMYVFTKNITDGVENVEVKNMTEVNTGCLHDYQLLPEDMKTIEKADIFVINGAGMESFMSDVIQRVPNLDIIEASEGAELLFADGHTHEHSENEEHHHEEHEYNSHVWLSPNNAIIEVENITKKLIALDPENAEKYKANSENYIASLKEVDNELKEMLKAFEGNNIIATHEAFDYMAKEYSFNIAATIQTGHNQAISAAQMAELVETAENENVAVIAAEEQYESTLIDALSRECGAPVAELNAMVSGGDDYKNVYRDVMVGNAKALINS